VHCLLTFLIVITSFFAYSFFYRHPGLFEPRKQKELRAINEQEKEEEEDRSTLQVVRLVQNRKNGDSQ